MSNNKERNLPQYVLYESRLVGPKGLWYAINDAIHLKVPLAIHKEDEALVLRCIENNEIQIEVILV